MRVRSIVALSRERCGRASSGLSECAEGGGYPLQLGIRTRVDGSADARGAFVERPRGDPHQSTPATDLHERRPPRVAVTVLRLGRGSNDPLQGAPVHDLRSAAILDPIDSRGWGHPPVAHEVDAFAEANPVAL